MNRARIDAGRCGIDDDDRFSFVKQIKKLGSLSALFRNPVRWHPKRLESPRHGDSGTIILPKLIADTDDEEPGSTEVGPIVVHGAHSLSNFSLRKWQEQEMQGS